MVVLSKLFAEGLRHCECRNDLFHSRGCLYHAVWKLLSILKSVSIYFAPIIFMPLVLKIRKLNRELLLDTCKYYAETLLGGIMTSWPIVLVICLLRRLLGAFYFYTLAAIPTLVGGISGVLCATPRVRRMFYMSTIQCAIESLVIRRENLLTKLMADSKAFQTLVFMCCSSVIMDAKRNLGFKGFWFLQPNANCLSKDRQAMVAEEADKEEQATEPGSDRSAFNALCTHEERSCFTHVRTGVQNYLAVGLTLDVVKMLMGKAPASASEGLLSKALAKFSTFRIRSAAFLAAYVGLYRFTHCYLNRKTQSSRELNHLLAAFLGGISYTLCPKLTLRCYGVVTALAVFWARFKHHRPEKPRRELEFLQSIPWPRLLYVFSLAYLVHTYTLRRSKVSHLGHIIVNALTDNYARDVNIRVVSLEKVLEAR